MTHRAKRGHGVRTTHEVAERRRTRRRGKRGVGVDHMTSGKGAEIAIVFFMDLKLESDLFTSQKNVTQLIKDVSPAFCYLSAEHVLYPETQQTPSFHSSLVKTRPGRFSEDSPDSCLGGTSPVHPRGLKHLFAQFESP